MDKILQQIEKGDFDYPPKPKTKERFISYPKDPIKTVEERKQ